MCIDAYHKYFSFVHIVRCLVHMHGITDLLKHSAALVVPSVIAQKAQYTQ